ncbi:MAG: hypothetical protein HOB37_07370 [Rhodospirillaceae bacterium]|jgi:hypothetical protein|nr:hypothetical protein [Rhodospirillaceae bacterium]MBT7486404.1 hypothetical protein [Rhodospirillales bacterium]MBT3911048.1 hypothetical protein [Rhodospirillaceae bacterium]MBT5300249.1 hypothetical protein [Rhodospirillaceae bacterium]MBT5515519.1 hypothetical protein [Rhodospirillaceae bacterium]
MTTPRIFRGLCADVIWRCAVIAMVPVLMWSFSPPAERVIWDQAGGLHYQVRQMPGTEDACLVLRIEDTTPNLAPYTCWR